MRWPVMMYYHCLWPSVLVNTAEGMPCVYAQQILQFDLDDV